MSTATTTDTTLSALHRAILENPNDDLARLVYADRLDEHEEGVRCGECDSGRVISISTWGEPMYNGCKLCNGTGYISNGNAERAEMIRAQITSGIASVTVPECLIGTDTSAYVQRGFVSSIRLTAEQFEQHASELFAQHPITEVVLSDKEPLEVMFAHAGDWGGWRFTIGQTGDYEIPRDIFAKLPHVNYRTRELALTALSRACVLLGRRRAGLPEEYPQ